VTLRCVCCAAAAADDDDDDVGRELEPECASELKEVRRSLLEDYRISPAVEQNCADDVKAHCGSVTRRDVVHCLMDIARHQYRHQTDDGDKRLTAACYTEVCLTISVHTLMYMLLHCKMNLHLLGC